MSFHYHKIFQPICLGYLATLCRDAGMNVEIIDANAEAISSDDPFWSTLQADVFVVTTASNDNWQCPFLELDDVKKIIDNLLTKQPILTYGPLVTEASEYTLRSLGKQVIGIRGEPEFPLFEVIQSIRTGKDWRIIDGISFTDLHTGEICNTKPAKSFPLDALPRPAYDLFPMEKYYYEIMGNHFCTMETSRGCPYQCNFCLKSMFGDTYNMRNPKKVVEDMIFLHEHYGVKNFFFHDLEFTIRKKETLALCKEICSSGLKINYAIQARADRVDEDILLALKKSGCTLIHFGVESGDPDILRFTKKMITLDKIKDGIRRTKDKGIKTLAYFTIGHPPEKREDILRTISFSKELNPDYASFVIIIPYPGLPIHNKSNPAILYVGANDNLSLSELEELRKKGIKEFYLRPSYILQRFFTIRSLEEFKVLWTGFTKLFIPLLMKRA